MKLDLKLMRFSAAMSSAVMVMGCVVFGSYWLGHRLDVMTSTSPLFAIGGLLVGIVLGLGWVLFVANKAKP